MIREDRYNIIKRSDAAQCLNSRDRLDLVRILNKVNRYRAEQGKEQLAGVVVENDWPIVEEVWALIEKMEEASFAPAPVEPPKAPAPVPNVAQAPKPEVKADVPAEEV